ncbi:hypothetical protein F4811DRAFT_545687 [Daldinia bambusicola]|nr:hypothetical protein F4811DRAFT_545687 [Daldinia bambusicola]
MISIQISHGSTLKLTHRPKFQCKTILGRLSKALKHRVHLCLLRCQYDVVMIPFVIPFVIPFMISVMCFMVSAMTVTVDSFTSSMSGSMWRVGLVMPRRPRRLFSGRAFTILFNGNFVNTTLPSETANTMQSNDNEYMVLSLTPKHMICNCDNFLA